MNTDTRIIMHTVNNLLEVAPAVPDREVKTLPIPEAQENASLWASHLELLNECRREAPFNRNTNRWRTYAVENHLAELVYCWEERRERVVSAAILVPQGAFAALENVISLPEVRGHGYGRAVVKGAFQRAAALRCQTVFFYCAAEREEFYRKAGCKRLWK
jgi:N-acetylglutamate synthase-like GNAT family acetyltransferase